MKILRRFFPSPEEKLAKRLMLVKTIQNDAASKQMEAIRAYRESVDNDPESVVSGAIEEVCIVLVSAHCGTLSPSTWDTKELVAETSQIFDAKPDLTDVQTEKEIREILIRQMTDAYVRHRDNIIASLAKTQGSHESYKTCSLEDARVIWEDFLRMTLCNTVDSQWRNRSNRMETLDSQLDSGARSKIADKLNWFIDQDDLNHPIGVYKREAAMIFFKTMEAVSREVISYLCHMHTEDIPHK